MISCIGNTAQRKAAGSPDPYMGSMDLTNPQSLNRYAYVNNNPLGFVDPLGLVCSAAVGDKDDTPCNNANYGGGGGSGSGLLGGIYLVTWTYYQTVPPEVGVEETPGGPVLYPLDNGDGYWSPSISLVGSVPLGTIGGGGLVQIPLLPSADPSKIQQINNCLNSYYNPKIGKTIEFGSLLSMVPGWDPEPGKNVLENIFLMGGKLLGLKAAAGMSRNASVPSIITGSSTSIAGPLESATSKVAGKVLTVAETASPYAVGAATTADVVGHYTCAMRAYPTPSVPSPF